MRVLAMTIALSAATVLSAMTMHGAKAQSPLTVTAGSCSTDDEVTASDRALYETPAMQFVEALLGDKPEAAYSQLADQLRAKLPVDDFLRSVNQGVRPFRPFEGLHIQHSYRVSEITLGSSATAVACSEAAHGDLNSPEGRVIMAALPAPLQAHVIIEGTTKNNRWAFVLWLSPSQQSWRINAFHILPITILDRSATDLWNLARQEGQRGHVLNSYLLYTSAAQLAFRGPNLQFGIQPEIEKEMGSLEIPLELKGEAPYEWKFPDNTYHVIAIGPLGVGGEFVLRIAHKVAQTGDQHELERQNRALIKAFRDAHPEYRQIFDGLVAQAVMPDGSGFGTVEQTRGGP
jgi:hypothetical protein